MGGDELTGLAALRFNYAQVADDVWHPSPFHVESLHRHAVGDILDGLIEAEESLGGSPIGLVLQGQRGAGKTHLLGWARRRVHEEDGYFFLISLLDARDFWESVAISMLDGLSRPMPDGRSQLAELLWRLAVLADTPPDARAAVTGETPLTRDALDAFIGALRRYDREAGRARDTARALVLRACADPAAQDVGDAYLSSSPAGEAGERAAWGFTTVRRTAQEVVGDLSRLLALTGPSVIAVDQLDVLLAQSAIAANGSISVVPGTGSDAWREALIVEQVAGGLMELREVTRRTLTVVSCLPSTWILIQKQATGTVRDRFRLTLPLGMIPDPETGAALIEKRFATQYRAAGFAPPYPTWPVRPEAFARAAEYTPRQLLIRIDEHVRSCLTTGVARELESLGATGPVVPADPQDGPVAVPVAVPRVVRTPPRLTTEPGPADELAALDVRFAQLRAKAQVADALDPATEDATMPALLTAGLAAWIMERGEAAGRVFGLDPLPSAKPPLHARLRRTLDELVEDEAHWSFRAIAAAHPVAALNRLKAASVMAGLDAAVPKRRLFVLRNHDWAKGPRTREALDAFERAGGRVVRIVEEDLRIFSALRQLIDDGPAHLRAWLSARRPASEVKLFGEALSDAGEGPGDAVAPYVAAPAAVPDEEPVRIPAVRTANSDRTRGPRTERVPSLTSSLARRHHTPDVSPYLTIGTTVPDDAPARIELETLRKHTAIFAGSGSGKTVLIRRLIEECALQGVSTIVLDPNNDLARMGERWPEPPADWAPGDAGRADDYFAGTDVVVWTPGRDRGRPVSFQPLPDFAGVADDEDEFQEAVEAAVASLIPRAKLEGTARKAHLGRAVLREAVTLHGRRGGTGMQGLINLLSALPDDVSRIEGAFRIAAELAQNLNAAMVIDPLFGGGGQPVDPGVLLTPPPGKRARVSVISLAGLAGDAQRQSFVNQLQLALFAWIKRNPAGDRPLGGLFVMDEAQTFAPSGAMTPCTQSTLALASQARKYGLGLVFATQAPKGLHNRIPGNAATQFFGLLNAPVHITAAREMAAAKGGEVPDISRLGAGRFYAATEGSPFRKIRTPLCLSHHPKSPLTTEEVVALASRD
ncbi:DUF87 domain-containing protein [Microbispora sp. RL4-1S]|uniref:DUF87 domain-containing protein n=2 Tax=Microbispora oryzae TaxID=2806554 RepID=A0A940WF99_9ACTN|nr:DUF87 domain-containing protein [Microbispora oryzae]